MVSRPHATNLVAWAKDKPSVVVLSADLTASCEADDFREAYPERFFSMGMAEQNMVSFAGGMAREGFFPFVHTFSVFICRRAFDQVAMSVAYPNLPVRFLGFLPGLTTPGGVTHQATDDLALMRALPNMTVIECGDATDVESVLDVAQGINGPVYVRMLRGLVPRLFDAGWKMRLGRARSLSTEGFDVTILSSGVCTQEVMRLTPFLEKAGVNPTHFHVTTIKPFNDPQILNALRKAKYGVITIENHSTIGGLGSAVAEMMAENAVGTRLVRLGLQDTYAHGASLPYLMRKYGLDSLALRKSVEYLTGRKLEIENELLERVELAPAPIGSKAEDL